MKRILYVLIGLLAFTQTYGQVLDRDMINYQTVMFDTVGRTIASEMVGVKVSLLTDSATGTVVYAETHSEMTNENGLLTIAIGGGTALTGQYDSIDWSSGDFFLKTEADLEGGTNYTRTSIQKFMSVPFALHAKSVTEKDPMYSSSLAAGITSADTMRWNNKQNVLVAGDGFAFDGNNLVSGPHFIGQLYGGGVIAWLDQTGEHGLILGMVDLSDGHLWSNVEDISIDTTSQWDGAKNTTAIINQPGHTKSAAKLCADYMNDDYGTGIYDDWYLPAIAEWAAIWKNWYWVQKALESDGNEETKAANQSTYHTSTAYVDVAEYTLVAAPNFLRLIQGFYPKSRISGVRPVRRF